MITLILAATSDVHSASMHWGNVIAATALVVTTLSLVLGIFFRLIKQSIQDQFALSAERSDANRTLYDERLAGAIHKFEERIDAVGKQFHQALESNRVADDAADERMAKALAATNRRLEGLDKDYRNFLANLPLTYVQRDDWIREFSKVDAKLDSIWHEITKTLKEKCN